MDQTVQLMLLVQSSGADAEELDRLTRELLDEVRQAQVESAGLVKGDAPAGVKAGGIEVLGTIAVQVLPAVIPALVGLVRQWAKRSADRSVKLTARLAEGEIAVEYPVGSMTTVEVTELVRGVTGTLRDGGGGGSKPDED
jgi:hypothetical protein